MLYSSPFSVKVIPSTYPHAVQTPSCPKEWAGEISRSTVAPHAVQTPRSLPGSVQVAGTAQAICVTHAPVLAAYADNNLLVAKHEAGGRTVTEVAALSPDEKVAEISRMLAGGQVTATTRQQAAELIAAGAKLKKQ